MSLHPPHLVDSTGSLTPTALIPFCAYQTNMTLISHTNKELQFDVCSEFKPTILEGQLCYSLNLSSKNYPTSKQSLKNGLLLIIDPRTSNKNYKEQSEHQKRNRITSLNFEQEYDDTNSARIYLNTLSSFTDYRAGTFTLTTLKKMTGTSDFLKLTNEVKKCSIETIEECQAKQYIENVNKQCHCVPWALASSLKSQVASQGGKIPSSLFLGLQAVLPKRNYMLHNSLHGQSRLRSLLHWTLR